MSAVMLSDFCFTFDAGCSGQTSLVVFSESISRAVEAGIEVESKVESKPEPQKIELVDCRSLVDLYDELLAASDRERRVSVKTIRDNRAALNKFEDWGRAQHRVVAGRPLSLLEQPKILRGYAEFLRAQSKGNSSAMASKACSAIGKLAGACVRAGILKQKPETVSKSTINLLRPRTEEQPGFDDWCDSKLESLLHDIKYHRKAMREEIQRTETRNKWVRDLKASLGVE